MLALAACAPCLAHAGDAAPQVSIEVNGAIIPLSVMQSFSNVASRLPPASQLEVDAHDKSHGARTYCYRYRERGKAPLLVELFDGGEFGLHTATVSRIAPGTNTQCPTLKSPPVFHVGNQRIDPRSDQIPSMAGFKRKSQGASILLEKEWTTGRETGKRTWFSITVDFQPATPAGTGFRSVTVQNWSEPG